MGEGSEGGGGIEDAKQGEQPHRQGREGITYPALPAGQGDKIRCVPVTTVLAMKLPVVFFTCALLASVLISAAAPEVPNYEERDFLARIRRLTLEGRRAGEGYWSPDGKRMVFQSEREPGNPFYQIYVLDLASGEVKRISPGIGKTTCAFFRPGSDEILFSSTHADPRSEALQKDELAFRASGAQRRYSWDFDPEMEIYVYSEGTGALNQLTQVRGYDAEAS